MTSVLKISLHGQVVGYLLAQKNGRTRFVFDKNYQANAERPTFSLPAYYQFPTAEKFLQQEFHSHLRLMPSLSNLLPEGALRTYLTQSLKIHPEHEFQLFSALGQDLPGALVATPIASPELPDYLQTGAFKESSLPDTATERRFSLAGVQMKMSFLRQGERFTLGGSQELGDWIIKTPSLHYPHLPENEFTAMTLAQLIGVEIPDIQLVPIDNIDWQELGAAPSALALAVKRYDRQGQVRIHQEDFAQVLFKHPHEKYNSANTEQIASIVQRFSAQPLADIKQLTLQMLANVLLANGDAHLKNFSLIYPNQIDPQLAPAYDIVTTGYYLPEETGLALNFAKQKEWQKIDTAAFKYWAGKAHLPWPVVLEALTEGLEKAKELWPSALKNLPAPQAKYLQKHWQQLSIL